MIFPKSDEESLKAFYGNPDAGNDGLPDRNWEYSNLVRISTPYPMVMAWNGRPLNRITIHRKAAPSLLAILSGIKQAFSEKELNEYQLNRFGGGYNFRTMRGGNKLSVHAYGAAIDLAPDLNPLGRPQGLRSFMMPDRAVKIFEAAGWTWGGLWKRPDGMHFQATAMV